MLKYKKKMENILDYKNVSETADEQKLIKLKALMDLGIEPYPHNYDRNINSAELKPFVILVEYQTIGLIL